jgi:hypothetical protein
MDMRRKAYNKNPAASCQYRCTCWPRAQSVHQLFSLISARRQMSLCVTIYRLLCPCKFFTASPLSCLKFASEAALGDRVRLRSLLGKGRPSVHCTRKLCHSSDILRFMTGFMSYFGDITNISSWKARPHSSSRV